MFKATVLTLQCSLLLAAFACNGIFDILIGFIPPTFVIVLALTKTQFSEGNSRLIVPALVVILLGCGIFNFIVCEIRVRLFSEELIAGL